MGPAAPGAKVPTTMLSMAITAPAGQTSARQREAVGCAEIAAEERPLLCLLPVLLCLLLCSAPVLLAVLRCPWSLGDLLSLFHPVTISTLHALLQLSSTQAGGISALLLLLLNSD